MPLRMPHPVIIGQSMGGYVGQMYSQLLPEKLRGFVSIDSAPLQRKFVTAADRSLTACAIQLYPRYAAGEKNTAAA